MPKETKGQGKRDVFKHREFIENKLKEGYALKHIYNELEGDMAISYRQFLRLIKKHFLINNQDNEPCLIKNTKNKSLEPSKSTPLKSTTNNFTHNPSINKKRMIELFGE